MTLTRLFWAVALLAVLAAPAVGQMREDPEFIKKAPAVGDPLPELTVYTADGKEFKTTDLMGNHAVITFGCLT